MPAKLLPIDFFMKHHEIILKAYKTAKNSPTTTWKILLKDFPILAKTMKYNTFKQYITPFAIIFNNVQTPKIDKNLDNKLHKVKQKAQKESDSQLNVALDKIKNLEHQLKTESKVRQDLKQDDKDLNHKLNNRLQESSNLKKTSDQLDKVTQNRLEVIEKEMQNLKHQIDNFREQRYNPQQSIKNIKGWTLQLSKDGYFRLYRKIDKELKSIYLGKIFDLEDAKEKIKKAENIIYK